MIHPIDLLGGLIVARGPDRLRFFSDGWGDMSIIGSAPPPIGVPQALSIEWTSHAKDDGLTTSVGVFESPAEILPPHARYGAVTRVAPEGGTNRVVVLMAALEPGSASPGAWPSEASAASSWKTRTTASAGLIAMMVSRFAP